jgi:hypothetical protein
MRSLPMGLLRILAPLAAGGVCYQIGGCGPGDIYQYVTSINPCGPILACNPVAYDFARSGIDSPGVHVEEDPFCTYPPFCSPAQDPLYNTVNLGIGGAP